MFHGALAADPAAIGVLVVAGAYALNHNGPAPFRNLTGVSFDVLPQLDLRHDTVGLAVHVFLWFVFASAGGDNYGSMADLSWASSAVFDPRDEISLVSRYPGQAHSGQYLDLAVLPDFCDELVEVLGDAETVNGVRNIPGHSTKLSILFDDYGLETLPGKA